MSPGRRAAQSTHPPCCGARNVVWKNDSPLSRLRLIDFMKPPSALDSISTPPDMAIIAPDSARHSSPGASVIRATAKLGLWRTAISMCELLEKCAGPPRTLLPKVVVPTPGSCPCGRPTARRRLVVQRAPGVSPALGFTLGPASGRPAIAYDVAPKRVG